MDISVNVTNAGAANVSVSNGSTVNATVGNGGAVNVAIGTVSPGNATVVAGTLTINSTTTLAAGSSAYAKNVGTAYAASLDIGIPAGPATLVTVGNTPTLTAGSNATVTGTTSGGNLTLSFAIPRGAAGSNGINGTTPTITASATTLSAGSSATVTATATNGGANVALEFGIPRGVDGTGGGSSNLSLSDATPSNLGTASAGTSSLASRADHVHATPVISYANLSGVPSNFPTNTTLVSGLSAGYSAINHAHNYVTSLNNLTGGLTLAAGSNATLTVNGSTLTIDSTSAGIGADDSVDGGYYVGVVVNGITFLSQPQSTSSGASAANWSAGGNVPVSVSGLCYAGSGFIGVSDNGGSSGGLLASSNGTSWSQNTALSGSVLWQGVSSANGLLFAVDWYTPSVLSSANNGATWSASSLNDQAYSSVVYGADKYLAVPRLTTSASPTNVAKTSTDGSSWTSRTLPYSAQWWGGAYGNGRFCLVGSYGAGGSTKVTAASTDGITWTGSTYTATSVLVRIAYGAGKFVALNGTKFATSTDGLSWSFGSLPISASQIIYANGLFIAVSSGTADVATSSDGLSWTASSLPSSQTWQSLAYGGGRFVAASQSAAASAYMAPSGASATFSVSATVSGGAAVSYQWQSSVDAGTTWANVSNATSSTLSLTGLTTSNSGTRYRAAASATGSETVYSQSATLTVS